MQNNETTSAPPEAAAPEHEAQAGAAPPEPKRFGTLAGVFTPTLLTILGVIMYLRLGWVVGLGCGRVDGC